MEPQPPDDQHKTQWKTRRVSKAADLPVEIKTKTPDSDADPPLCCVSNTKAEHQHPGCVQMEIRHPKQRDIKGNT